MTVDEVFDEFSEDGGDVTENVESLEEPASEGPLEAREGVGVIDEVACTDGTPLISSPCTQ